MPRRRTILVVLIAGLLAVAGCANTRTEGDRNVAKAEKATKKDKPKPKVNVRFVYVMCNDVTKMKEFYCDLLGMATPSFQDEKDTGWLVLDSEGMQLMVFRAHAKLPVKKEFAWQPGGGGGTHDATCWSIEVPEDDFAAVVDKLRAAKVKAQSEFPEWRQGCYWGFTVLDPMGNTVEVYHHPKKKPAKTEWPQATTRKAGKAR